TTTPSFAIAADASSAQVHRLRQPGIIRRTLRPGAVVLAIIKDRRKIPSSMILRDSLESFLSGYLPSLHCLAPLFGLGLSNQGVRHAASAGPLRRRAETRSQRQIRSSR